MEMSRRDAMKSVGFGSLAAAMGTSFLGCGGGAGKAMAVGGMGGLAAEPGSGHARFELPALPYAYDALEPVIDARTVEIHHDKHHAGYVKGANGVLESLAAARTSGDYGSVKSLSRDLAFNASGVVLHDLYWMSMAPKAQGGPEGKLAEAIARDFGSVEAMKAQFAAAAGKVEASGWALLVWEPILQQLLVLQTEKHQDLTIWSSVPLLVCDVWEHAYYLKYQNNRGEYVDKWMGIIDWAGAAKRLAMVTGAA